MVTIGSLILFTGFIVSVNPQVNMPERVEVLGTTTALIDRDSKGQPLDKIKYIPLKGVEVVALRSAPVAGSNSSDEGEFGLRIVSGRPFSILFRDPSNKDIVPELQQLCGKEKSRHHVHVTLLTVKQYDEIYGRQALLARLRFIKQVLANVKDKRIDASRRLIDELLKRLYGAG